MTWNEQFLDLYRRCLEKYRGGNKDFETYYSEHDLAFLASIGYKPRELFDFVEDAAEEGVPAESTALLIASVRRDFFHVVQDKEKSEKEISADDIPAKSEELDGMAYLPRIIAKARAKLAGELHPDLMFSCGGDRGFLKDHGNIHAADFLRHVWACGKDAQSIADFIKKDHD